MTTKLTTTSPELIGLRVEYAKGGSRTGWKGTIVTIDKKRVLVFYDNGQEQEYSVSALCISKLQGVSPHISDSTHYRYLIVTNPEPMQHTASGSSKTTQPLPTNSYLIVNMQTGEVVGIETCLEEAELFAQEQAQDSVQKHHFTVFKPSATFAVKPPLVERIKGIFNL